MAAAASPLWNRDAVALVRTLLRLRNVREAQRFLRDLMTEDELVMIVNRWRVARLLHDGRSYREIERLTGLSSRTIARISNWLQRGEGGYGALLARAERPAKASRRAPSHGHHS